MSELKDCPPLKYYDFKPVEHVKLCPRYTAVLGRSEDDGIGIEELDTLQLELETLLSSASRRLRALEEQRQVGRQRASSWCTQVLSCYDKVKEIVKTSHLSQTFLWEKPMDDICCPVYDLRKAPHTPLIFCSSPSRPFTASSGDSWTLLRFRS